MNRKQLLSEWTNEQLASIPIQITTRNSFPTAAGMASSASGIACLSKALSELYQIKNDLDGEKDLNHVTRKASGSACRSLYGGLVKWHRGNDPLSSRAEQVCDKHLIHK